MVTLLMLMLSPTPIDAFYDFLEKPYTCIASVHMFLLEKYVEYHANYLPSCDTSDKILTLWNNRLEELTVLRILNQHNSVLVEKINKEINRGEKAIELWSYAKRIKDVGYYDYVDFDVLGCKLESLKMLFKTYPNWPAPLPVPWEK